MFSPETADSRSGEVCHARVRPLVGRASLEALKNLLSEPDLILSTTAPLPESRTPRCRELLGAALALTDGLLKQDKVSPAVALGHKGGSTTSRRHGAEHYRMMAASRKTRGGGRPRKKAASQRSNPNPAHWVGTGEPSRRIQQSENHV